MILSTANINDLKRLSGLSFDKSKDYETLAVLIDEKTGRHIGVTTIKRLFGYIKDDRKANDYTLNTLAIYLGYPTWTEYLRARSYDSSIGYPDDSIYVNYLSIGDVIDVKYLNREVTFKVVGYCGRNALQVASSKNSSLCIGDLLLIYRLKKGHPIEAEQLIRDKEIGNYRTNGEITFMRINPS